MSEEAYWALAQRAQEKGIARSRMGQLAKLCNDFERATELLEAALASKKPSTYLGKIMGSLRARHEPSRDEEPEIALQARLHGWPVRKTCLGDGTPAWWVAGVLYNREGVDVGG